MVHVCCIGASLRHTFLIFPVNDLRQSQKSSVPTTPENTAQVITDPVSKPAVVLAQVEQRQKIQGINPSLFSVQSQASVSQVARKILQDALNERTPKARKVAMPASDEQIQSNSSKS